MLPHQNNIHLGIIGLGYVGLPLAIEFSKHFPTVGFDINTKRIRELQSGIDHTLEIDHETLMQATQLHYTANPVELQHCTVYIITVPTPIDSHKRPDFRPLIAASETVGKTLTLGNVVIYESTVYPGATEEIAVPILAQYSGLSFNRDFFVGYSPERMNPGDKQHRVTDIIKITAGSTPEVAEWVDKLYRRIIRVGTHKVSSIRVAEAAKVIENIQRDVNIALINELAMLFHQLNLDTQEVLTAAGTKWNFIPFWPGLVGGHCIGVDPYYLTHKAQAVGFHPEMILAGRRINDRMGIYIAERVIKRMAQQRISLMDARILIMGLTFKENCPDLRNSKVVDIIHELESYHIKVDVYDPWIDKQQAMLIYQIELVNELPRYYYDAIIIAVAHQQFREMDPAFIRSLGKANAVLFDVKYVLESQQADERL